MLESLTQPAGSALLLVLATACSPGSSAPAHSPSDGQDADASPIATQIPKRWAFPDTPKQDVMDEYHGVEVVDPYRWLEDADSNEVETWIQRQNEYSQSHLANLPARGAIAKRAREVFGFESPSYYPVTFRAGRYFARKHQPPKQQPLLVVFNDPIDSEEETLILDPNVLDPSGATRIDWFKPSPDAKLVAVSLSAKGTESGDVHLYESKSGKPTGEVIPRVQGGTAGGDLEWTRDGKGFFYTRYPAPGERPEADLSFYQQLYYHRLGTPVSQDRYELGKDLPKIAEIRVQRAMDSDHLLATVQKGDGGEFRLYLRTPSGSWQQFSEFGDRIVQAALGRHDDLYLLSRQNAPLGKIVRLKLSKLDVSRGTTVIAEGKDSIVGDFWGQSSIIATKNRLYVQYQTGGPSELRAFNLDGKPATAPEQSEISSAGSMVRLKGDSLLLSSGSFTAPWSWYHFDADKGTTRETRLSAKEKIDLSKVEVVRDYATSKDGTKVPVNILLPPGTPRDGSAPCVVTGYGGYGISLSPSYNRMAALLLEQGVVYAVANLRGGGEYGEPWHRAGNLTNKQNVFDDFAASIQHIIDKNISRPERIVTVGGSNGGLLMGATLVQNPRLMRAVVSFVGLYDMLRVELSPNGSFNITEFGTVKDRAQFRALHAYSPYHNVKDGTPYPSVLFLTGKNDPRVDPMQSRKMTARLQAATTGGNVLLRSHADSGHGGSKKLDDRIEEMADVLAFIFSELSVDYEAPSSFTSEP